MSKNKDRSQHSVFDLTTINHYLDFCSAAVRDFDIDEANIVKGFAAILALNHIPDWLAHKMTNEQLELLELFEIVNLDSENKVIELKKYFESDNSEIKLIRSIANGFKHLRLDHSTQHIVDCGKGPFGVGPYGAPYLLVDKGESFDNASRWVDGFSLVERVLEYWKTRLAAILG